MTFEEIAKITSASVITEGNGLLQSVDSAFGSDLMSDVLALVDDNTLLITGLNNQQVIRTAEMLDLKGILFVRDKILCEDVINLAVEKRIIIMTTPHTLFTASGLLYDQGLRGVIIKGA